MCRLIHIFLQTIICAVQMLIRICMTILLMIENILRMILQTIYNFISFILQMFSLIPICIVFIITARLKCLFCGSGCSGGYCAPNRGGLCDCMMSLGTIVLMFFVFRATGVLDKILAYIGYKKALTKFKMCRTVHAVLQTVICGVQMLVRVFMTVILMLENLIRMILQTLYNFISFLLQMLSLIPICVVFLVTARLKCFMCGGGGPCPVNRGGACDCLMSAVAIIIMFFIFRATGVLDKIFFGLGYTKARPMVYRYVPTPGDITECSRNDSDYTEETSALNQVFYDSDTTTELYTLTEFSNITSPVSKAKATTTGPITTTPPRTTTSPGPDQHTSTPGTGAG